MKDFNIQYKNEVQPELIAVHALNRFTAQNSAARCVMFGGQFAQRPVIDGSEPRINLTGVEEEFGRFTFSVKMPEDGTVISVMTKHGHVNTVRGKQAPPETLVIYQSHETGEFGCFTIPYYCSYDPVFGFKYEIKDTVRMLSPGADIPKDTIFADSPAVKGESHYTYSKNLNLAYMSHSNVGLDGFVIARDVLPYFKFRLYEKRVIETGGNNFLLNLYGNNEVYQPLPNIGEYVKENGLLAAIRKFDSMMAPAQMSVRDTQIPDYHFDEPIFARPGKGKVVDITVYESPNVSRALPEEMTEQIRYYHQSSVQFYREVIRFYNTEAGKSRRAGRNGFVPMTNELKEVVHTAMGITANADATDTRQLLSYTYKNKPIENWRIEVVIEYEVTADVGFKLSCEHGGFKLS